MQKKILPFTAIYPGGARHIIFPLHRLTVNADHVGAAPEALLENITRDIQIKRDVSDGDVLQALCRAFAARMRLVDAAAEEVRTMVAATLEQADDAVAEGDVQSAGKT